MDLTTLIAEQKKTLLTTLVECNAVGDMLYSNISDWHTTSTIQLLEAIVGEMEKEIIGYQGADDYCTGYNSALKSQINNLTAVIQSLK